MKRSFLILSCCFSFISSFGQHHIYDSCRTIIDKEGNQVDTVMTFAEVVQLNTFTISDSSCEEGLEYENEPITFTIVLVKKNGPAQLWSNKTEISDEIRKRMSASHNDISYVLIERMRYQKNGNTYFLRPVAIRITD